MEEVEEKEEGDEEGGGEEMDHRSIKSGSSDVKTQLVVILACGWQLSMVLDWF